MAVHLQGHDARPTSVLRPKFPPMARSVCGRLALHQKVFVMRAGDQGSGGMLPLSRTDTPTLVVALPQPARPWDTGRQPL